MQKTKINAAPLAPPPTTKSLEVWKTREAAAALGRSAVTLERWRRLRIGPPYHVICGRPVYVPAEVVAWFDAQKVVAHGAAA